MNLYANIPPGVTIQEWEHGTLPAKHATTAIPVFVGNFIINGGERDECYEINSLLELKSLFCSARATLSKAANAPESDGPSGSTRPGQSLLDISKPNCISGGSLIYKIKLGYHSSGYNTLKIKCQSSSTAKINVDFDGMWSAVKDNGSKVENDMVLDTFWGFGVADVNGVDLTVKTMPQAKGQIDILGNCYSEKRSSGYIWSTKSVFSESYNAVELYFKNGGGPCYILPLVDGNEAELAALPEVIRAQCPGASLLLCADTDAGLAQLATPRTKQDIYQALNPLLQASPAYFLLADSPDGMPISGVEPTQTAVYYPALQTSAYVDDEAIEVVGGYWQPAPGNLAQLKMQDPESYELIRQSLSPLRDAPYCPSSPAIAAAYCRNDRERGVWKAPANISLIGVRGLSVHVNEETHGLLNDKGINVIRWFTERGAVIYGARTLSDDAKWRYVAVRRLFNTAENDIKRILQPMVFEPNSSPTWMRAHAAVHNYLSALWRKGALAGDTEAEAFFVQIGEGKTMQPEDVAAGKMILQVGMAAVRPAEFIVLQFSQSTS